MPEKEVSFIVDASHHSIEGDLLPAADTSAAKTDEPAKKQPVSRAAAVKSLGGTIGAGHWIAAKLLDESSLELSKDEKRIYGEVSVDLLKAYGVDLATHPKASAWINFSVVVMEIDGPRAVLVLTKPPEKKYTEAEEGEVPPLVYPESGHG